MNRSTFIALGFAGALAFVASPAAAQHRGGGGGARGGGSGAHAQTHAAAPRGGAGGSHYNAQPRSYGTPRAYNGARTYGTARAYNGARYYNGSRYYGGRYYGGRYYGGRYYGYAVGPRHFISPYYVFHPRFSVGFGLWAGYPFAYYDPFYYPYAYYGYDYPYAYPYAAAPVPAAPAYPLPPSDGSVAVAPNEAAPPDQSNMGGLSFDITPSNAELFVDGHDMGTVSQFTPSSQPLGLPAGTHHIELRAAGYPVRSFDVNIVAGQVIPYQGTLER